MDVWLKRLVGRYQFEGLVEVVKTEDHRCGQLPPDPANSNPPPPAEPWCSSIKGKGDCIAIGTGAGVQCVLNVTWQDLYDVNMDDGKVYNLPGGVSYLDPAMLLFGLDPGKSGINYLLVDNKGLPEGGLGFVAGNRATFKTPCVNGPALLGAMKPLDPPARTCDRTIYIDAKPDAKLVFMSIDIDINEEPFTRYVMSLRRVPQVQGPVVSSASPASR